ncbi:hypothetical protein [[Clostridium] aminophilum]|uniref:Tetratricopeptide repeat-containing protein n=1 Tax=[Clostridium] aminophilum TaxID=1526 RepID=A0A1I6JXX1_9FIRM|nr:hypothetical protein [[Clostridium] aminophilum]SFR83817.1 hypothetical protein SAMN02910262_02091 [[Clostridium] aminophilum]
MDKFEFKVKIEQIKKLVNKSDYETAMKIADAIDWRRVKSTGLLTLASSIYEKNREYSDAKDILLIAYERAPIGRTLLTKLTDLALREGNVREAEAYYKEYCEQVDDNDSVQHLLRFLILEAKGASVEQQINSLEMYCNDELDDKWLYHLAELYREAGREDDCVRACDKIMLMFGIGKYVDKAMALKQEFAPLNSYQKDLAENRQKYERKLQEVEEKFRDVDLGRNADADDDRREPAREEDEEPESRREESRREAADESLEASLHEARAEEELAREVCKMQPYENTEAEEDDQTRVLQRVSDLHQASQENAGKEDCISGTGMEHEAAAQEAEQPEETMPELEDWDLEEEEQEEAPFENRIMLAADDEEAGLKAALGLLKEFHEVLGVKRSAAKISGDRLAKRGVFSVAGKLEGKDLIIERAADLDEETLEDLNDFVAQAGEEMSVILIDDEENLSAFRAEFPAATEMYGGDGERPEIVEDLEDLEEDEELPEVEEDLPDERETEDDEAEEEDSEDAEENAEDEAEAEEPEDSDEESKDDGDEADEDENADDPDEDEREAYESDREKTEDGDRSEAADVENDEMDVEDFVQYACRYAADIDCSIDGKSKLALYERAEMMEEDGVPLTRESAADLIEHAADKAEKKHLFAKRYDKNGLLILREKHFFD